MVISKHMTEVVDSTGFSIVYNSNQLDGLSLHNCLNCLIRFTKQKCLNEAPNPRSCSQEKYSAQLRYYPCHDNIFGGRNIFSSLQLLVQTQPSNSQFNKTHIAFVHTMAVTYRQDSYRQIPLKFSIELYPFRLDVLHDETPVMSPL